MTRAHLLLRAKPGRRDELLAALDRLELAAATSARDLIEVEVFVPLDDPESVLVVSSWPSPQHYERWRDGDGFRQLPAALGELLAAEPSAQVFQLVDAIG